MNVRVLCTTSCLLFLLLSGCSKQAKEELGPPLVEFIVDRTTSTTRFQTELVKYASEALFSYSKEGSVHFILVNLNEKPSMDMEKKGDLTSDQVEGILTHIKGLDYNGKGTDVIGAFDKVYEYYTFEKKKPRAFYVLCFTDGLVESPPGTTFRKWSELNTERFKNANAHIGVYFLDSSVRASVEQAFASMNVMIKEKNEAVSEVKEDVFELPGLRR